MFLLTSKMDYFKFSEEGYNKEDDIEDQEKNAIDSIQVETLHRNQYER